MADLNDLAAAMFNGSGSASGTGSGGSAMIYGTAVSASANGSVEVYMGGDVVGDERGDEATAYIDVPTTFSVTSGDKVLVVLDSDGHPTVVGVVGRGDDVDQDIQDVSDAVEDAAKAAQEAQEAADKAREEADAQISDVKTDLSAFKETASATYSTKEEVDEKTGAVTKDIESKYLSKEDAGTTYATKTELTESADGVRSDVSSTYVSKEDAGATYATKTELSQTSDTLSASISDSLTSANEHADSAVADEATKRDAAIEASAGEIRTEVSTTYAKEDGTGTGTLTSQVKQNSTSITQMFTTGTGKDVKDAADSAKATADSLSTLIREDSTGITVGKSTDGGTTYSGNRTHMGTDSFDVVDKSGNVLSRFAEKLIELGKNSKDAVIRLCNGVGELKQRQETSDGSTTSFITLYGENAEVRGSKSAQLQVYTGSTENLENAQVFATTSHSDHTARLEIYATAVNQVSNVTPNSSIDIVAGNNVLVMGGNSVTIDAGNAKVTLVDATPGATLSRPSGDVQWAAKRSDTGTEVRFGVGSGGTNHGVWSVKQSRWLLYGDASDVYLGRRKLVPVYRLHNTYDKCYLFTQKTSERDTLVKAGWVNDGIQFYALAPDLS